MNEKFGVNICMDGLGRTRTVPHLDTCSTYKVEEINTMTSNLRQSAASRLIEMMVAVLVLSIGLLGIAGMQAATSKYKINSWSRSQASVLLSDLAERVRINPGAGGTNFSANGATSTSLYVLDDDWVRGAGKLVG